MLMASACVNNVGILPEKFLECEKPYSTYKWFAKNGDFENLEEKSGCDSVDFEFRLEDPISKMLPADELFSDGKILPLQIKPQNKAEIAGSCPVHEISPKVQKSSSRWKELIGLKKTQKSALVSSVAENAKSLKNFLHINRKSASSSEVSLNVPLLKDSESESVSISSRLSLSSSSSGADHDDFPRISFDFEKPHSVQTSKSPLFQNQPKLRVSKVKYSGMESNRTHRLADSVDSPRLNASGRVIFKGLERSSSSPSSFNGGSRSRPRGMERSYSANVRVTPVLNVPVCTLRGSAISGSVFGLGQIFSPQKKEKKIINGVGNGMKVKNDKSDF